VPDHQQFFGRPETSSTGRGSSVFKNINIFRAFKSSQSALDTKDKKVIMPKIVFPKELRQTGVQFSNLERNKSGGKQSFVSLEGCKEKVLMQIPSMTSLWGIQTFQETSTGQVMSYTVDLSFRNMEDDPKLQEFYETVKYIDDTLLETAVKKSEEWFGKELDAGVVREFMRPLLRQPNPDYAPTIRLKIPSVNGKPMCAFFDESRKATTMDYCSRKGTKAVAIVELSPVWFVSKSFGVTMKVLQFAALSVPDSLQEYAFQEEESEPGECVIRDSSPTRD
jgi:hypothetical protein